MLVLAILLNLAKPAEIMLLTMQQRSNGKHISLFYN